MILSLLMFVRKTLFGFITNMLILSLTGAGNEEQHSLYKQLCLVPESK